MSAPIACDCCGERQGLISLLLVGLLCWCCRRRWARGEQLAYCVALTPDQIATYQEAQ